MSDSAQSESALSQSGTTILRAGVEEMNSGYWVLTVFDLIGCYSSGPTAEDAAADAGRRIRQYFEWIGKKDGTAAPFEDAVQVTIVERHRRSPWAQDGSRFLRAFYEDDARPLRLWDLDIALRLLDWSRQDLLQLAGSLLPDFQDRPENEPRWKKLDDLVGHIWKSENAILDTLGAAVDITTMPSDGVGRLQAVREKLRSVLPQWAEVELEREVMGERWSPRKVLRRALWHERDHVLKWEELTDQMT